MVTPSPLVSGDKIALVASARKVSPEEMQPAADLLAGWGFEVVKGMYLYEEEHQFAGSDSQRWADLQMVLDDPSIKAVLFARGGYGTVRIVDKLDFSRFLQHPKWLIGFSDITVLHSHVQQHVKVETLHAPMAINFPKTPSLVLESDPDFSYRVSVPQPVQARRISESTLYSAAKLSRSWLLGRHCCAAIRPS